MRDAIIKLKAFVGNAHQRATTGMNEVERAQDPLPFDQYDDQWRQLAQQLFFQLTMYTEGTPPGILRKVSSQDGFEACRRRAFQHRPQNAGSTLARLIEVLAFDFGSESDRAEAKWSLRAKNRLAHPASASGLTPTRPSTPQNARSTMQAWELEVAEFEVKYVNRIDEDAKVLAPKTIMLDTLFGEAGVFRSGSFSTYADLRVSLVRYLDDKVPVSMMKPGSPSTTNLAQNLNEKTQESEEKDKSQDSVTQEALFAMEVVINKRQARRQRKGIIYNIDDTSESGWWTPSDSTGSEYDLHFCITEKYKCIVRDEQERARTARTENSKNIATGDKIF